MLSVAIVVWHWSCFAEARAPFLRKSAFEMCIRDSPPPPKPQVDWGAIVVEGMRTLSTFATALSQGATPNSQAFAALAGLAASAAPVSYTHLVVICSIWGRESYAMIAPPPMP